MSMFGYTYVQENKTQLNTEMYYCLHFYHCGKEMSSAVNVAVIFN